MTEKREIVLELDPRVFSDSVCSQCVVETYECDDNGKVTASSRTVIGAAVHARDRRRLYDLIRAYQSIVKLIKEEMR